MKVTLAAGTAENARAEMLAIPVFEGREIGAGAGAIGDVSALAEAAGFEGKTGETLVVPVRRGRAATAVLVGVGKRADVDAEVLRRAAAAIVKRAAKVASVATTLLDAAPEGTDRAAAVQAITEGALLGAYRFSTYKSDSKPQKLTHFTVVGGGGAPLSRAVERGTVIAGAVAWARDLVNEPSLAKSPAVVAEAARALARESGLKATVMAGTQLERARFGGVLGVGQGSSRPPRFVKLAYEPPGAKATVAFVGKGVVFDSGGLSLKPAAGMETMKTDMSGAAAVIAAMSVLKKLGVKTRVVGYVPLVENMPSGTAIRPGDVLKIRNGKTVEVLNTDAEGRLILADALSLAAEEKPDAIVDLATLTGACPIALGEQIAGLMGNDEGWIAQVRAAADRTGEKVWPLPLPREYRKLIDSEIADIKNTAVREGGTLTAGLFLQEFCGGLPWAHLDIAGPARSSNDDGHIGRGGTGFGVRLLVELAATFGKPKRA